MKLLSLLLICLTVAVLAADEKKEDDKAKIYKRLIPADVLRGIINNFFKISLYYSITLHRIRVFVLGLRKLKAIIRKWDQQNIKFAVGHCWTFAISKSNQIADIAAVYDTHA